MNTSIAHWFNEKPLRSNTTEKCFNVVRKIYEKYIEALNIQREFSIIIFNFVLAFFDFPSLIPTQSESEEDSEAEKSF